MDEVVWRMSARNLIVVCGVVVDADSKQEVEEAVHQTHHKQPNWKQFRTDFALKYLITGRTYISRCPDHIGLQLEEEDEAGLGEPDIRGLQLQLISQFISTMSPNHTTAPCKEKILSTQGKQLIY